MTVRRPLLALLLLLAAACSGGGSAGTGPSPPSGAVPPDEAEASENDATSAAVDRESCTRSSELPGGDVEDAPVQDREFPWLREDPSVLDGFDFSEVISGGPPPDGIRPIEQPCFEPIAAADTWLEDVSPLLAVEVDGDRRAYPLAIMTQHEIANDVVGGVPLVVTYCPLCNSGLVFERTVDGQVLDFGTSGRLYRSNLVMYDRQTRTLWSQFLGQAVVGEDFVGTELERVPSSLLQWSAFRDAGEGLVLSRDSVEGRSYGRNPYPGYEGSPHTFLYDGPIDDQLPPATRVVGLGAGDDPVAVPLPVLMDEGVLEIELDGDAVSLWWTPGQASALDQPQVDAGQDVGSTVAYHPTLEDGTTLTFEPAEEEERFRDTQTGSSWNLFGEAVEGELAGTVLEEVPRADTFWFVWFAFQPETRIVSG